MVSVCVYAGLHVWVYGEGMSHHSRSVESEGKLRYCFFLPQVHICTEYHLLLLLLFGTA